jgi:hypothetical protein
MPGANSSKRTVLNPPKEETLSQSLVSSSAELTTTTTRPFALNYVTFKASSPTVQTLTVKIDSISGADFDTVILKETICLTDFIYYPDKEMAFPKDSQITATCTNNGAPASVVNIVISTQEI